MEIYEFIGLPGAGKSTICNKLKEEIDFYSMEDLSEDLASMSKVKKMLLLLKFISTSPKLIKDLLFMILNNWKKDYTSINMGLEFLKIASYSEHITKSCKKNIIILDQGIIQAFWAIFPHIKTTSGKEIEKILKQISTIFKMNYIFVEVDKLRSIDRIKSRTKDNCVFKSLNDKEINNLLNHQMSVMEKIFIEIKNNSTEKLLIVNGIDDLNRNSQEIINFINLDKVRVN